MKSQFLAMAFLGLGACLLLVLLAFLVQSAGDQTQSTTQTARQKAIDAYMSMYAPGGITGVAPSRAPQTRLASPPSALPKPGTLQP
jgi:hypothetical protein